MSRSINTDPLVVLHVQPLLVQKRRFHPNSEDVMQKKNNLSDNILFRL